MSFLHLLLLIFSLKFSSAIERDTSNLVPTIQPNDIVLQFRSNGSVDERIINLEANSYVRIRSINVPKSVAFAVVQAHSQVHRISMSQARKFDVGNHVNGTSIGILVDTSSSNSGVMAYLINTQPVNITVLAFILYYDRSAPIPGGCNLEFEMPVSPWLRVSYNQSMVNVDHELAALPPNQGDVFPCESESLLYEVYHYYLAQRDFTEDSFFNAIRLLRTVNGAKEFGTEIRSFGFTPTTRSRFSLYPGLGQVFVVTVTHLGEASRYAPASAYIPSVTYGCDLSVEGDCQTLSSTYVKVLCAFSLFLGLFIAFAGHRYFQLEMILAGFIAFSAVSYIILVNHFDPNVAGLAAGTSVMGLLGGLLWWFVWWFWGIPALSVLPVVFMLGFLMSSVLFYLPISFEFLTNDFNFWSAFCCCWLVLPVIFVTFTRMGNIVSCAVLGSYAVIVPIDHYIGSSLKYIVINVVRRATVFGFGRAVLDPPYQDNDLILSLAWIGLIISGATFQYLRERRRPPFSPPADIWRPLRWTVLRGTSNSRAEQTPLIVSPDSGVAHYGTA
ncbi:transmembrane 7 superfamily member 3-like [Daphnia pulicaria]|uniref:transmembrane 7 superfamily member 3-like n=1 Tax=Daphnia pulicaria TaxID=35523 RepID=UPI001EEAAC1D|nr:transmembrane 7 superfamily member 3-like [Daphnia pulicaria]